MERDKTDMTPAPSGRNEGNGKANTESPPGVKTLTTWRKIGRLEKFKDGAAVLLYKDFFRVEHRLYISWQDIRRIKEDRSPGDVVRIDEIDQEIVISPAGWAYRSRGGRTLCMKLPGLAGVLASTPWSAFLAVLEGRSRAAPLSVLSRSPPNPNWLPVAYSGLMDGLARGP
jgi:hypothetical protein